MRIISYLADIVQSPLSFRKNFKQIAIIFISSSIFIIIHYSNVQHAPVYLTDTSNYFAGSILDPWSFTRTPGLRLYAKALGIDYHGYVHKDYVENNKILNDKFIYMFYSNIIFYALSISMLLCILSTIVHPIYIGVAIITYVLSSQPDNQFLGFIPPPVYIMPDQPSFFLCAFFYSSSCIYFKYKKYIFLFITCTIAILACQFKPVCIFLSAIAGLICLYDIYITKNMLKPLAIIIFLICGTFIWPVWLYINSGVFFYSQLSIRHGFVNIMHFINPDDENLFDNENDKKFIRILLSEKKALLSEKKADFVNYSHSMFRNYIKFRNIYGFDIYSRAMMKMKFKNRQDFYVTFKRIYSTLSSKYKIERMHHICASIIYAFSPWASPFSNFLDRSLGLSIFAKYCHLFFLLCICCSIIILKFNHINYNPIIGKTIILGCLIHILHVFASSIGHTVIYRYALITEWAFLLSTILSIYVIILSLFLCIVKHRRQFNYD